MTTSDLKNRPKLRVSYLSRRLLVRNLQLCCLGKWTTLFHAVKSDLAIFYILSSCNPPGPLSTPPPLTPRTASIRNCCGPLLDIPSHSPQLLLLTLQVYRHLTTRHPDFACSAPPRRCHPSGIARSAVPWVPPKTIYHRSPASRHPWSGSDGVRRPATPAVFLGDFKLTGELWRFKRGPRPWLIDARPALF